jgi:hypothetical protein
MQTPTALRSDPLLVVIGELPWFLTDEALRAARAMKFVPATKDGQPSRNTSRSNTTSTSTDRHITPEEETA